jgi:hypothetical protein
MTRRRQLLLRLSALTRTFDTIVAGVRQAPAIEHWRRRHARRQVGQLLALRDQLVRAGLPRAAKELDPMITSWTQRVGKTG